MISQSVIKCGRSIWGIATFLAVLVSLFFLTQIHSWNHLIFRPDNEVSDLTITFWPNIYYIKQSVLEFGQLPLWRTLIFSGSPFDSDPQSGLWYLPNLVFLVLPLIPGFNTLFVLHMVAAGVGVWLWSRSTGTSYGGSLLAAIAVAFIPKVYAHLGFGHLGLLYGAAYIPWVLWAAWSIAKGNYRFVGVLALTLGLQIIANPQLAVYTGLTGGLYGIATALGGANKNWEAVIMTAGNIALAGLIAFGVSSVQVFPMLRFAPLSARSGMGLADTMVSSLPPRYLFGLFLADYVGFMDYVVYVGLPVIALAILAYQRRQSWFWWGFVLLAFLFSMGEITPIYPITYRLLPLIRWLRAPTRILFIPPVAMAVMAGWGFDFLLAGFHARKRKILNLAAVGICAFALFLLLGYLLTFGIPEPNLVAFGIMMPVTMGILALIVNKKLSQRLATLALGGILIVDLSIVNSTVIEGRSLDAELADSGAGKFLAQKAYDEIFRIYSPSYSLTQAKGAYLGLDSVNGVDPLYPKEYDRFMQIATGVRRDRYGVTIPPFEGGTSIYHSNEKALPRPDLLGILNVKYILAEFPISVDGLQEIYPLGSTYLYENRFFLPRMFVLGDVDLADNFEGALLWLQDHDPTKTAIVTGGKVMRSGKVKADIAWIQRSPNRVSVEVTVDKPGLLVFSQYSYLDWKAWVNGREANLYPAYGILSGLYLDEGTHIIVFAYQPSTLYWGIGMSFAAVMVSVFFLYHYKEATRTS